MPSERPAEPDPVPHRPLLLPGWRVARRTATTLQVGVGDRTARVPDQPGVREQLALLGTGQARSRDIDPTLLARLTAAGLVADAEVRREALAAGLGAAAASALVASDPATAAERLAARRAARVTVEAPPAWQARLLELALAQGLRPAEPTDLVTVRVLVTEGELDRERLDEAVRLGEPHLVAAYAEGVLRLGPFVQPGVTACLRCVDAHLAERDRRRGLLVHQVSRTPPPPGVADPADPAVVSLGLGWLVRDLVRFVEGGRPSTWSATVAVSPDGDDRRTDWTRHPHCGCAWGEWLAWA